MNPNNQFRLADALDRVLAQGVALSGDITLSLANIELVYLGVRLLLTSVATLEADKATQESTPLAPDAPGLYLPGSLGAKPKSQPTAPPQVQDIALPLPPLAADPNNAAKSLVQLVLTLVNIIRELMEKQAMRRVDAGHLTDEEVERLGLTLMKLEEAMAQLKAHFGLSDDDLELPLGIA